MTTAIKTRLLPTENHQQPLVQFAIQQELFSSEFELSYTTCISKEKVRLMVNEESIPTIKHAIVRKTILEVVDKMVANRQYAWDNLNLKRTEERIKAFSKIREYREELNKAQDAPIIAEYMTFFIIPNMMKLIHVTTAHSSPQTKAILTRCGILKKYLEPLVNNRNKSYDETWPSTIDINNIDEFFRQDDIF